MKNGANAVQDQRDPAAFPFTNLAALRQDQRLNLAPANIGPCRAVKNRFERGAMLAVHRQTDSV